MNFYKHVFFLLVNMTNHFYQIYIFHTNKALKTRAKLLTYTTKPFTSYVMIDEVWTNFLSKRMKKCLAFGESIHPFNWLQI